MIKCNNGKVRLKGSVHEVCADLAIVTKNVVQALVDNGMSRDEAVERVEFSTKLGLKTEEEIHEEAQKLIINRLKAVVDALEKEEEEEVNE